ncbi:N-acetyl-gamma-glutamyl-phosphate reductase [Pedobacter sp. HMF7647]|uniref:N-acetyl-gamma-glutamyl-phosphate reductase n=1 Tax=Hufsiella arboris TaxID=2695275 RepID=A0A7K1Y637_9SPHI|nr:N-acetyl-gamma-glutamyl-phosphate reductase [Hufsiella arboris]MXV50042.1 N-acetyl-gamma-glutamyl-phosphate reductase [Hufsiella arboris]
MASKIKTGIVGGAGYTGGELLRILINHPYVDIAFVNSSSNAGNYISDVHTDLFGDTDLKFSSEISQDIDVLFLCVGHGDAVKFLQANPIDQKIKVIDLSQDFRLAAIPNDQSVNRKFVYGLPELNKDAVKSAENIANPGCFATCIQLGLLPLASKGLLTAEVHINAITGSTGAGQSLSQTSHFTWRNNNLSVYKAFGHQHLNEISQSIKQLQPEFPLHSKDVQSPLNFIPQRGDFTRGIFAAIYTDCDLSLEQAQDLYEEFYAEAAFTHISKKNIDLKQVVNTNKCIIHLEKHDNKLFIISIMDNLLKGASGQAVQNMNLMFEIEETAGLRLKGVGF